MNWNMKSETFDSDHPSMINVGAPTIDAFLVQLSAVLSAAVSQSRSSPSHGELRRLAGDLVSFVDFVAKGWCGNSGVHRDVSISHLLTPESSIPCGLFE
jgi:hypothetical protein